jgi:hypothetical protein
MGKTLRLVAPAAPRASVTAKAPSVRASVAAAARLQRLIDERLQLRIDQLEQEYVLASRQSITSGVAWLRAMEQQNVIVSPNLLSHVCYILLQVAVKDMIEHHQCKLRGTVAQLPNSSLDEWITRQKKMFILQEMKTQLLQTGSILDVPYQAVVSALGPDATSLILKLRRQVYVGEIKLIEVCSSEILTSGLDAQKIKTHVITFLQGATNRSERIFEDL